MQQALPSLEQSMVLSYERVIHKVAHIPYHTHTPTQMGQNVWSLLNCTGFLSPSYYFKNSGSIKANQSAVLNRPTNELAEFNGPFRKQFKILKSPQSIGRLLNTVLTQLALIMQPTRRQTFLALGMRSEPRKIRSDNLIWDNLIWTLTGKVHWCKVEISRKRGR